MGHVWQPELFMADGVLGINGGIRKVFQLFFQVVHIDKNKYAMTCMGFGLNIAPRVVQVHLDHILRLGNYKNVDGPYRDDLVVVITDPHGAEKVVELKAHKSGKIYFCFVEYGKYQKNLGIEVGGPLII
jgi:hypothetical protein